MTVLLQCASHDLPDSGLPCNAPSVGGTFLLSTGFPCFFSCHSAHASSICMCVLISDPGECAHASLASPPNTFLFGLAAMAQNSLCTGCSTQEECVGASTCDVGAAHSDLLQQSPALLVPSHLTLHCQCGRSITGFNLVSVVTGSPNICRCSNRSSCLVSPACHRSHVARVFSFFLVKNPDACISYAADLDCVALIDCSVSLVDMSASLHSICSLLCAGHRCGRCSFDVTLSACASSRNGVVIDMLSSVGAEVHSINFCHSLVLFRLLTLRRSLTNRDCSWSRKGGSSSSSAIAAVLSHLVVGANEPQSFAAFCTSLMDNFCSGAIVMSISLCTPSSWMQERALHTSRVKNAG